MAWTTVTIQNKQQLDGGVQRVNIRFATDDPTPRTHDTEIDLPLGADSSYFDAQVRLWLKRLTDRDTVKSTSDALVTGNYVPGAAPAPDPDQSLMDTWKGAVNDFRQAQKGVDLGLFATNSTFYTTPQTAMMNIWNSATTAQKTKGLKVI